MADKLGGTHAFHDWLSASAYVKGADQTARVVSKKKHRSKRNSGLSDSENERLQAEERIRALWKLSNRHYRRWMNDRLLRELTPPLDAQEIGSLFAPPPWGEKSLASPFERVSAYGESWAQEKAAWEPFRNNVDMDMEARVLHYVAPHQGKTLTHDAQKHKAAAKAWQGVSHKSRDVLRRSSSWHLVNIFEVLHILVLQQLSKTLSPSDKLHSFIEGLEPNPKDDVHKFDPATLDAAIAYVERLGHTRRKDRKFFPSERSFNNNRSFQRDNRGRYSQNQRSSQNFQPARQYSSGQFFGQQSFRPRFSRQAAPSQARSSSNGFRNRVRPRQDWPRDDRRNLQRDTISGQHASSSSAPSTSQSSRE
ncbi:hypothetical protein L7F22_067599 [Adiantum nelumboides]|nr:hypothetical protein [Adiantum nelumboides]